MHRFCVCSFPSCMEHPSYPRHCPSYHRISIWLRRLAILGEESTSIDIQYQRARSAATSSRVAGTTSVAKSSIEGAQVGVALGVPGACRLVERDLHPIGRLDAGIAVAPGHLPGGGEELRACLLEDRSCGIGIGHRQRQAHWSTHAPAHFHLVNKVSLRAVKEFECGLQPEGEDHPA